MGFPASMEEKEVVSLNKKQVFELVQIIFDNDKDAAFKFLEEIIYKPLQKRKEHKCKPSI
jgi:hypothetical protein